MLDDRAIKDRSPFDVTTIEDEISTLIPRGVTIVPPASIRRPVATKDRRTDGSAPDHPAPVEAPAGPTDATEALLAERETTHGSFANNARVSQAIKRIFRAEPGWELLTDVERESMDMIALKFSRVLSGKSMQKQHWEDITGYARLVEEKCEG